MNFQKKNPWDKQDCKRENCFSCESAVKFENCKMKNCRQRSVLYETWCETCKKRNIKESSDEKNVEKSGNKRDRERNEKIDDEKIYRYIGETSRSIYERGIEHKKDLQFRRTRSHLLRHCVEIHSDENPDKIEFGMRLLSSHKSAFERQLSEAVMIEKYNGQYLLNSKLE